MPVGGSLVILMEDPSIILFREEKIESSRGRNNEATLVGLNSSSCTYF